MRVLIDTNILLDIIQERQPFGPAATRVWKLVEEGQIEGCVSAISFNNIYDVARKQVGAEKALEAVRRVRQAFQFVPITEYVIDRALGSKLGDFEDAIQAAAAVAAHADLVVTRNAVDFTASGVPTYTAEETLALLAP
jgi:predicted nucleic acid-binding protein